jgi:NAD(P)H dehydrogenase (quinone)
MDPLARQVLVYGANGVQGGAIARRLQELGFAVRGAVRDPVKSQGLRQAGIEVVAIDLDDEASLRRASDGMHAVVLTPPLDWNRSRVLRHSENAVRAARQAGVPRLVLNTATRIPAEITDVPAFETRRAIEDVVLGSGVSNVILRPPMYLDNLDSPWISEALHRDGVLVYPVVDSVRMAWMSVRDLGSYAAVVLRESSLLGRRFDVGGPDMLSGPELAMALGRGLGHAVRYAAISPEAIAAGLTASMGSEVAQGIAKTYAYLAQHPETELFATGDELRSRLDQPLTSAEEFARARRVPVPLAKQA